MRNVALLLVLAGCPRPEGKDTADTGDTGVSDTGDTADTADTDTGDTAAPTRLPEGFEAELDATGGCSDTWLQVWDADGNVGLEVYRAGLLDAAVRAGTPVEETLTLGVDDVTLVVEIADPVAINYCTDALSERDVHARYEGVSGTLTLRMTPPESEWGNATATLTLDDVLLADEHGHTVTIGAFTSPDIGVLTVWGG